MQRISFIDGIFGGTQSALDPGGPGAAAIAQLSWVMIFGGGAIFAVVMAMLAFALIAAPGRRSWLASRATIVLGGIIFPVVVLSVLLVYGLLMARTLVALPTEAILNIHVTGEQFWWRVRYEAADGEAAFDTANEIHVPVNQAVRITLATADVIHSFWMPALGGKLDMIPGQVNTLLVRADRPGVYRGQCTEFCGAAHALMAFDVVVHEPGAFAAWRRQQRGDATEPGTPFLREGGRLFQATGCGACHTVRGTEAKGRIGPDLTHVGSRRTIAAGVFPNNQGTLAGWIADNQHLKPANRMPSFNVFTGRQLRALAAYLESLK
jgi:cytochrome c oxidase subunit 2